MMGTMPAPPASTKTSLTQRLNEHARQRWPQLDRVEVRFRSQFAYIDGIDAHGEVHKLCRLRYNGSAHIWGFAMHGASHDDYEDSWLPTGGCPLGPAGTPWRRVVGVKGVCDHDAPGPGVAGRRFGVSVLCSLYRCGEPLAADAL